MAVLKIAQRFLGRWSAFRLAQLGMGVVSIGAGIQEGIFLLVVAGFVMIAGSLLGVGCAGACPTDAPQHSDSQD